MPPVNHKLKHKQKEHAQEKSCQILFLNSTTEKQKVVL